MDVFTIVLLVGIVLPILFTVTMLIISVPFRCSNCGSKKYHWHTIGGKDGDDYNTDPDGRPLVDAVRCCNNCGKDED